MKITLNIPDWLVEKLRQEAARRGTTMSALVEAGLRRVLADPATAEPSDPLRPLPSWNGGGFRVDVTDREALGELLDSERDERLYGITKV